MKKLLSVLLSLLFFILVFSVSALASEQISGLTGDCTWSIDGSTLTVSGYGDMADYSSNRDTPWYNYSFSRVVINEGVKHIGNYSFANCYSVMYATLPSGLISVGDHAFTNTGLIEITLPKSLVSLGDSAFSYCQRVESVTLHENFESYGSGAFGACESLKTVNIADNNPYFKLVDGILYNEDGTELICYPAGKTKESFTIPENVTSIGCGAFYGNEYLKKVILHQNVTEIKQEAFYGCSALEDINIPEGITELNKFAFARCSSLTSLKLPDSLIKIGHGAFYMGALEEIVIPKNVTEIGVTAFYSNSTLVRVTLPKSLETIASDAFFRCDSLDTVYYCGSAEQKTNIYIGPYNAPLNNCNWFYNSCIGRENHETYIDEVCNECGFVRLLGDSDTNGKVDTSDLAALKINLSGSGIINLHNADVKQDGVVDTSDLATLKLYLAEN